MNPIVKHAARAALPHLATLTRGRKRKMAMRAGKWAAGHMVRKQKHAVGMMALKGLGAAALAIPVGMWVGRKLMERSET